MIAVLPVSLFLVMLVYLDSYKLLKFPKVIKMVFLGGGAAFVAYLVNMVLLESLPLEIPSYTRYVAPIIEESIKAFLVFYLIKKNRINFLVGAAIGGFAVGSGFALVENLYFLYSLPPSTPMVWIIRGFGTAMMHGACSVIFAIITELRWDKEESWKAFLPGLLAAISIHSFYNCFLLSPFLSVIVILFFLPFLILFTLNRSEMALEEWIGVGIDAHAQLLSLIHSGEFHQSKTGIYLNSLCFYFSPAVVVDMLCYLRIQAELSMLCKGILLAQKRGFNIKADESVQDKLRELSVLEASIGATGKRALTPILGATRRDKWQLSLLVD